MTRFRITVEYDGTDFVGWQRQDNGLGVQQVVEDALFGFCGERITVFAAGRTDAGVHALGQVAHFDIEKEADAYRIKSALNYHLQPHPVAVLDAQIVGEDFHSRFDAIERQYLYRIMNRRAPLTVQRKRMWWVPVELDAGAMHEAAQVLVGQHDFTTFRATLCQSNSPVKTLDQLDVERIGDEVRIHARARSFLHHQVRNITGTLVRVGEGKWSADDLRAALEARDRSRGGQTAPPDGLYLTRVGYENE